MVVNAEVKNLASKAVGPVNPERTTRVFNAGLTIIDSQGNHRPYLAETAPQLNTDTWQTFPDGRMETIWKLRPNLTWHDGQPLTADDVVFAFQVYTAPALAAFEPKPQDRIEQIIAVDPRTVRIQWRSPYLDTGSGLEPLPRHRMAEAFAAFEQDPVGQRDAFLAQRFWTTEYVGAGPFRLTNWEPASFLEGVAFEGHALGKPKIERVVMRLINDENTAMANILAGDVHMITRNVIGFQHAMILRGEGFDGDRGKGTVALISTANVTAVPQHRPDYQQTPALHDVRVRKAIAHAIDKEAINDGLLDGQGPINYAAVPREAPYFADVDRAITKYVYDPRRTEQYMAEAGYSKDRDGFFAGANGERFQPAALWAAVGAQREQLLAIMVNTWQRAGIDVQPSVIPNAVAQDPEANSAYPGIVVHGISGVESTTAQALASEQIGSPANRWQGGNRGGWSNPDYDRLWDRYNSTLDRPEQVQTFVQMLKLQSELLPNMMIYSLLGVTTHTAALKGPEAGLVQTTSHWNMYDWELSS